MAKVIEAGIKSPAITALIFYPNIIAQDLVDIQPLAGQVGQIFVMRPRYEQTVPGITPGSASQVFVNYPTYQNYASEDAYETIGTGNGTVTAFTYTVSTVPIRPSSVVITAGGATATDDGNGNLVGTGIAAGSTVNYLTGAVAITFTAAPANAASVSIQYTYSTEVNDQAIRTMAFDLSVVPVKAKLYPLRYQYSVAAGLAAQAHLAVDVQDTLAELVAQYIKVERDNKLISAIAGSATANALLNFDCNQGTAVATTSGSVTTTVAGNAYIDKRTLFSQIEIKLDEAEALIQTTMGRGGVDFVLCGYNAANVFRQCRSFRPEPVRAPIGAHRIGTLRDGTVSVIKVVNANVLNANQYVFGFKGYMTGDSATILAEWIPMYFSPVFQAPTLTNSQGAFSAYDLYVNEMTANDNSVVKQVA